MLSGAGTGWSPALARRYRAIAASTVLVIAILGISATLDLFDVPGAPALPWMGDRGWVAELVGGLAGAVVIPLALAATWGRFRVAGAVVGVTLAVLLHVTLALVGLTAAYRFLEWLTARVPRLTAVLAGAVVASAVVVFVVQL
jgi:hypothetical protein